jgi:small subunit ribosomal protein S1
MDETPQTIGPEPATPQEVGAEAHPMDALLGEESYDLDTPRRGEIRQGTIARISDGDILVDIGAKSEGVIPARELERMPAEYREGLSVGSEVSVYVVRSGGGEEGLLLSLARAEEEHDWMEAERLLASQDALQGVVAGYNKGGLIVKLGHLRGFIPASQVSLSRRRRAEGDTPDKRWGKMVGEPIVAKVIEVDRRRNRLIFSERAAAREARKALKERLIGELKPGEIRSGHVISLADFGAFVDIGGADGLVHLSEISWKRVAHPKDLLKVGQEVQVKVLGVDAERKRISLSMRELEPDPWERIAHQFREGQLVEGKITKLTKFGAFASLTGMEDYEIEGLIHISELADRRVEHPREVVQEGQTVTLRVIKIDQPRRRIGLSLKRVDSAEYADLDWQTAMSELTPGNGASEAEALEPIEDFDAELDAEAREAGGAPPEEESAPDGAEPVDALPEGEPAPNGAEPGAAA